MDFRFFSLLLFQTQAAFVFFFLHTRKRQKSQLGLMNARAHVCLFFFECERVVMHIQTNERLLINALGIYLLYFQFTSYLLNFRMFFLDSQKPIKEDTKTSIIRQE